MTLKNLAIFCGAHVGARPEYVDQTRELALALCEKNITLVYGGASVGIMGELADTMLKNGGDVIGVIPKSLVDRELAHTDIAELHVVDTLHERKETIFKLADGFILLPGGLGSLDEFFEVLSWSNLGFHSKPMGILNTEHYYDSLVKFIDRGISDQFIRPIYHEKIIIDSNPQKLLTALINQDLPMVSRWDELAFEGNI